MSRHTLTFSILAALIALTACGSRPYGAAQAPLLGTVSPASGSGRTQVFTATYSHPVGGNQIVTAFLLVEKTATGVGSCFIEYNSLNKTFNLMNDAGKWQTAVPAGTPSALANTQCSIDVAAGRGSIEGNTLTVTAPLTFSPAYAGRKEVFLSASAATVATPWESKGSWVVP